MPINVFDISSNISEIGIHASLFVQKPYFRTYYIEIIIEEDIDWKNQTRFKNLSDPISVREVGLENYVDN